MKEIVSRRVMDELEASGYQPRLHPPAEEGGPFEVMLPGDGFDLNDIKAVVRVAQMTGAGLKLDDKGRITFS
jgi:hypothetical protein